MSVFEKPNTDDPDSIAGSDATNDQRRESVENQDKQEAIRRAQEEGMRRVTEQFGPHGSREELAYHNETHTRDVMARTATIMEALHGSREEIELAKLAAAWHDVVQESNANQATGQRVRDRTPANSEQEAGNEYHSYQAVIQYLNNQSSFTLTDSAREQLKTAILATTPDFSGFDTVDYRGVRDASGQLIEPVIKDARGPHIDQPILRHHLEQNPESPSKIVLAVALADLGASGLERGEKGTSDGDAEYRETRAALQAIHDLYQQNPDADSAQRVRELLYDDQGRPRRDSEILQNLNSDEQQAVRANMLNWLQAQPGFAEYQRKRFYELVSRMPEDMGAQLQRVFSEFDGNIRGMRHRYQELESKSFLEITQAMGYPPEHLPAASSKAA